MWWWNRIETKLDQIIKEQRKAMADATQAALDLQAAISRLGASISAEIKAVSDKLSAANTPSGVDPATVENAVASLNTLADTVDAETASLATPAVTPAPAPAPAPAASLEDHAAANTAPGLVGSGPVPGS
jgi:hypothetical protein